MHDMQEQNQYQIPLDAQGDEKVSSDTAPLIAEQNSSAHDVRSTSPVDAQGGENINPEMKDLLIAEQNSSAHGGQSTSPVDAQGDENINPEMKDLLIAEQNSSAHDVRSTSPVDAQGGENINPEMKDLLIAEQNSSAHGGQSTSPVDAQGSENINPEMTDQLIAVEDNLAHGGQSTSPVGESSGENINPDTTRSSTDLQNNQSPSSADTTPIAGESLPSSETPKNDQIDLSPELPFFGTALSLENPEKIDKHDTNVEDSPLLGSAEKTPIMPLPAGVIGNGRSFLGKPAFCVEPVSEPTPITITSGSAETPPAGGIGNRGSVLGKSASCVEPVSEPTPTTIDRRALEQELRKYQTTYVITNWLKQIVGFCLSLGGWNWQHQSGTIQALCGLLQSEKNGFTEQEIADAIGAEKNHDSQKTHRYTLFKKGYRDNELLEGTDLVIQKLHDYFYEPKPAFQL